MLVSSLALSDGGGRPSTPALSANAKYLLETVVCDVHWTAMQIGTITMLLARARAGESSGLQSGRHLVHDDSKTMLLALRYATQMGLGADIVAKLTNIYRRVGEAKLSLAPLTEAARLGRAQQTPLQAPCDVWRRIAGEAAATIAQLQSETGARLAPQYAVDADALRQFLDQAARGDTQPVDRTGAIATPKLQQRRQAPRLAVSIPCTLQLPTGAVSARVVDVSSRGLGVACNAPLADKQKLTVVLEDGRSLEATVVRRQGERIGLQLARSLPAADPLFLSGVERRKAVA
jgi:hypothetical protein